MLNIDGDQRLYVDLRQRASCDCLLILISIFERLFMAAPNPQKVVD